MSGAQRLLADFLDRIGAYHERRDYPAVKGPSYLSVHLRFGTVSIRELAARAHAEGGKGAETWLSELVWRDFYFGVLHHFPHVVGHAFRRELDHVAFENDPGKWRAWCAGADRLSARRRGDAPDQPDRVHAQPAAHGGGVVPGQGPARRLAVGRAVLRRPPERLRPRREQRRLAMGRLDRVRCAAVLPDLQSGDAVGAVRPGRKVHPPLRAGARARAGQVRPCAMGDASGRSGSGGVRDRPGLSRAGRRSRPGAADHAGALPARGRKARVRLQSHKWDCFGCRTATRVLASSRTRRCAGAARLPGMACRGTRSRRSPSRTRGACRRCAR